MRSDHASRWGSWGSWGCFPEVPESVSERDQVRDSPSHALTVSSNDREHPHDPHDPHGGRACGDADFVGGGLLGLVVSVVEYRSTRSGKSDPGLLGIVLLRLGGALLIEGVAVRRTRAGRLYLAFPSRVLRTGERRHVVRPVDAEARRLIEEQVFAQLRAKGVLP